MLKPKAEPVRIAIDTGGTFTDCVWIEDGQVRMHKVFSTPADPSVAIVDGMRQVPPGAVVLLHGTTVGTNTLLQRKGARVALVVTAGFEDAIEIGRQNRPRLYDLFFDRAEPLVSRDLRFGIAERTLPDGSILRRPAAAQLSSVARDLVARKPGAIAVCLLFSFANPGNERAVAKALQGAGIPLSLSHQILPEFREYERMSTVVVNAYLQPVVEKYLQRLQARVAREPGRRGTRVYLMQSSGGITALRSGAREPVRTVLSGPAGGVVGASAMARRSGSHRIITFDMGGTSTDVCLIDGEPQTTSEADVAGLPVRVPMLNIHTVGAGGGSLARFDAAGALRVGPESAGADPGPVCYGRGLQPTVTDANLLLGRLQPDRFLGGEFRLSIERTRTTVQRWLESQDARLSLHQLAYGIVRVVNATMEKAIRVVSIEKGYDPRDFTLVAFGGAGGLHACDLARALAIPRVIVPALPGALSAYGILVSDVVKDYSRTVLWRVSGRLPAGDLRRGYAALQRAAIAEFREERWGGRLRFRRSLDVRYRGQGFELNVPYGLTALRDFHTQHRQRYGYSHPEREVEIVTLRLRAALAGSQADPLRPQPGAQRPSDSATRPVFFEGKPVKAKIVERQSLLAGRLYVGPAVVTEYSATTVVAPGMTFRIDAAANLVIDVK